MQKTQINIVNTNVWSTVSVIALQGCGDAALHCVTMLNWKNIGEDITCQHKNFSLMNEII